MIKIKDLGSYYGKVVQSDRKPLFTINKERFGRPLINKKQLELLQNGKSVRFSFGGLISNKGLEK